MIDSQPPPVLTQHPGDEDGKTQDSDAKMLASRDVVAVSQAEAIVWVYAVPSTT